MTHPIINQETSGRDTDKKDQMDVLYQNSIENANRIINQLQANKDIRNHVSSIVNAHT